MPPPRIIFLFLTRSDMGVSALFIKFFSLSLSLYIYISFFNKFLVTHQIRTQGMLDGKAIAAKRLLKESAQGIQGFANEVMMIAECSTCQFSTSPWLLRRGRRNGNSVWVHGKLKPWYVCFRWVYLLINWMLFIWLEIYIIEIDGEVPTLNCYHGSWKCLSIFLII